MDDRRDSAVVFQGGHTHVLAYILGCREREALLESSSRSVEIFILFLILSSIDPSINIYVCIDLADQPANSSFLANPR